MAYWLAQCEAVRVLKEIVNARARAATSVQVYRVSPAIAIMLAENGFAIRSGLDDTGATTISWTL